MYIIHKLAQRNIKTSAKTLSSFDETEGMQRRGHAQTHRENTHDNIRANTIHTAPQSMKKEIHETEKCSTEIHEPGVRKHVGELKSEWKHDGLTYVDPARAVRPI